MFDWFLEVGRGNLRVLSEGGGDERMFPFLTIATVCAIQRADLDYAETLLSRRWPPASDHYLHPLTTWVAVLRGDDVLAQRSWQRYQDVLANRALEIRNNNYASLAQLELIPFYCGEECEWLLTAVFEEHRAAAAGWSVDCARGLAALHLDRVDEAERHFARGQEWAAGVGFPIQEGRNLHGLALVAERRGDAALARRLSARARPLFEDHEAWLFVGHLDQLEARLGDASPSRAREALPAGLTRREVEVLALLAAGRTNREIAEALVLSPRTVENHVDHIYQKTGSHSRVLAAAFAARHGLSADADP
jgi:DNA-binding CsgD family transcriptional regulator